jgi:HD-GYP domain-containing protein (c-di-GMP phosphodiesterase class II)
VNHSLVIPIAQLRVGMFIQLDLGWMQHPFPVGSFRVASEAQIDTLRSLGLKQIRYVPGKSDPEFQAVRAPGTSAGVAQTMPDEPGPEPGSEQAAQAHRISALRAQLQAQHQALAACDQRFLMATRTCLRLGPLADKEPIQARAQGESLVGGCVDELLDNGESVIRLLSEGVGERNALHPVNVMVLSLLLGKAEGASADALRDIGLTALFHDLGKTRLPAHQWMRNPDMTAGDLLGYQKHVAYSVAIARRMGLPAPVLRGIAEHHEMADGSGFPEGLSGPAMGNAARVVGLVNYYDRLCNPVHGAQALTPHEALSLMFAKHKVKFDARILGVFIRMMGIYPPGSIVQLVNDRYAIVVSVNSSRPLKPRVIVHDPQVPKDEALILDLETVPELGIRRSLKPTQLPREALDYLSPRKRICYFFERAVDHQGLAQP